MCELKIWLLSVLQINLDDFKNILNLWTWLMQWKNEFLTGKTWKSIKAHMLIWICLQFAHCSFVGTRLCLYFKSYQLIFKTQYKIETLSNSSCPLYSFYFNIWIMQKVHLSMAPHPGREVTLGCFITLFPKVLL